jgi:hypothetical protein
MKFSCWKNLMTENFNARVQVRLFHGLAKVFLPQFCSKFLGSWNTLVFYCTRVINWMCHTVSIVLVLALYYMYCYYLGIFLELQLTK